MDNLKEKIKKEYSEKYKDGSEIEYKNFDGKYVKFLKEVVVNEDAIDFLFKTAQYFRTWDNVFDQDKPYTKEEICEALEYFSFGMSRNKFYQENKDVLDSQIFLAWLGWQTSNVWINEDDFFKRLNSYFLRNYASEIDYVVIWLLHGKEAALKASLTFREEDLNRLYQGGLDGMV